MENNSKGPIKKMEDDKNDATKPFPNAEKPSAAQINNGDKKSRNYMEGGDDINGPDFDKKGEGVDSDTSENAGIFK